MARKKGRAEVVIAGIDKVAAPIRKINRSFQTMLAPINKIKRNLRSLSKEMHFDKLGRGLKSLGRGLRNVGIAAVVGIGVAIAGVKKLAAEGDNIAKMTRFLQFNAQAFQELEFAANIAGIGSEAFRKNVTKLVKNVGELKAGMGTMTTILDKVAPAFKQQLLATKTSAEAFELMLEFISKLKDPMKQAAAANMAFGRSGMALINFAMEGKESIKALRLEAVELGIVMTDEELGMSESMIDTFTRLTSSVKGMARIVGFALFPVIEQIALSIKDWSIENRQWLKDNVPDAIDSIVKSGKEFLGWIRTMGPRLDSMTKSFQSFKNIAKIVGGVIALTLLAPLILIVSTIGLIPTLIIAAGIAIVAFADEIGNVLTNVWDNLSSTIGSLVPDFLLGSVASGPSTGGASGSFVLPSPSAAELNGSIRVELAGAEPKNIEADFGSGIGVEFTQAAAMPVE